MTRFTIIMLPAIASIRIRLIDRCVGDLLGSIQSTL